LATFPWKDTTLNLWDISSNIQFTNVLWTFVWSNKYQDRIKTPINFDPTKIWWKVSGFFKDLF
jgi:hypothetical protein